MRRDLCYRRHYPRSSYRVSAERKASALIVAHDHHRPRGDPFRLRLNEAS